MLCCARRLVCTWIAGLSACALPDAPRVQPSDPDAAAPSTASVLDGGFDGLSEGGGPPDAETVEADAGAGAIDSSAAAADAGAPPDAAEATSLSLVDMKAWREISPSEDPFTDRPEKVDCRLGSIMPETLAGVTAYGVETGTCNYVTVSQPTLVDLNPGDHVAARVWHFELSAPEAANAHVAVRVGALRVLDETIAMPGAGGTVRGSAPVLQRMPAGTPAYFHLHNHGANSWAIVELVVTLAMH